MSCSWLVGKVVELYEWMDGWNSIIHLFSTCLFPLYIDLLDLSVVNRQSSSLWDSR